MKVKNRSYVLKVANQVREELIEKYSPIEKKSSGLCRLASYQLAAELKDFEPIILHGQVLADCPHHSYICEGVRVRINEDGIVHSGPHFWLKLGKGQQMILDITADQFNCDLYTPFPTIIYSPPKRYPQYQPWLRVDPATNQDLPL